jgi:Protein of unknown function (DUF3306)
MSASENFFTRWSRRKRAQSQAAEQRAPTVAPDAPASSVGAATQSSPPNAKDVASPAPEVPFDLSKLPPIESITAGTDIRGFLAPGVPAELARAALRRAWAADPAIREFIGLSENSWDFNSPGAIAGFGPLEMTEDLRRRIAEMVGRSIAAHAREEPSPAQGEAVALPSIETSAQSATDSYSNPVLERHSTVESATEPPLETQLIDALENKSSEQNPTDVAAQHKHAPPVEQHVSAPKRTHGRALPK